MTTNNDMIIIRKANANDVESIIKMWKEFMKIHDAIVMEKNPLLKQHIRLKKDSRESFQKFIKKQIKSTDSLVSIAEIDGKPIGYALSFIKRNIPVFAMDKIGYISDMYIEKEYNGMGIGSKLKNEAVRWFKKKNIKNISLIVFHDNEHARKVYEKWGFFNYSIEMRKGI